MTAAHGQWMAREPYKGDTPAGGTSGDEVIPFEQAVEEIEQSSTSPLYKTATTFGSCTREKSSMQRALRKRNA
jgi:hypothetical protein